MISPVKSLVFWRPNFTQKKKTYLLGGNSGQIHSWSSMVFMNYRNLYVLESFLALEIDLYCSPHFNREVVRKPRLEITWLTRQNILYFNVIKLINYWSKEQEFPKAFQYTRQSILDSSTIISNNPISECNQNPISTCIV